MLRRVLLEWVALLNVSPFASFSNSLLSLEWFAPNSQFCSCCASLLFSNTPLSHTFLFSNFPNSSVSYERCSSAFQVSESLCSSFSMFPLRQMFWSVRRGLQFLNILSCPFQLLCSSSQMALFCSCLKNFLVPFDWFVLLFHILLLLWLLSKSLLCYDDFVKLSTRFRELCSVVLLAELL